MLDEDFSLDELYPVRELPMRLPSLRAGSTVTIQTVYAWLNLSGLRGKTLRSVAVGRVRMTCDRWLKEFMASSSVRATITPARQRSKIEQAENELVALCGFRIAREMNEPRRSRKGVA